MRDYDAAFSPIVVGERVFFGSSADEAVHCLDAETGETRWSFTTDGPVRIAPTWSEGRVYFGSDGYACSVDVVRVTLEPGWNPLLLKIRQGGGGWEACCRGRAADGAAIEGLRIAAEPNVKRPNGE